METIEIVTEDLVAALMTQRNIALDDSAKLQAAVVGLRKKVKELEEKVASLEKKDG